MYPPANIEPVPVITGYHRVRRPEEKVMTLAFDPAEKRDMHGRWTGGPAYHGTSAVLNPGDVIEPGHEANFDTSTPGHVYFTDEGRYGAAVSFAKWAARKTGGQPRVYRVEPLGEYEKDPDFAISGGSYRTKHPVRVVEEDEYWKSDPRWQ